ncbi:MAG: hypothetical protein FJX55_10870 [Alphaproteobacteria bacterium]|nr:hypothetical protein [Alphaproteobacteria bacterium]
MAEVPVTAAQIARQAERLSPRRDETVAPGRAAEATFYRIVSYIREFEANMDAAHEVGARMVSFGDTVQFHIVDMGYWNPDIVTFDGLDEAGRRMKLIQNVSQLNVLLIAMPKRADHEEPRRIGFVLEKKAAGTPPAP